MSLTISLLTPPIPYARIAFSSEQAHSPENQPGSDPRVAGVAGGNFTRLFKLSFKEHAQTGVGGGSKGAEPTASEASDWPVQGRPSGSFLYFGPR